MAKKDESRIDALFARLRARNEAGLVAFLVAGDPTPEDSFAFMEAAAQGGADILEVGLPFSDPLADGKVIQEGSQRALAAKMTPTKALEMVARLRARHDVAIVLFSCYNLLVQFGLEAFAREAKAAGVDGVLVTDLPPEEGDAWWKVAHAQGLDTIFLVSPITRDARIDKIAALSSGFIYGISRMGVTGARAQLPADLPEFVGRLRKFTRLPVALGFGISDAQQVREVCGIADAAVVGSALVAKAAQETPENLKDFVASLKAATKTAKLTTE